MSLSLTPAAADHIARMLEKRGRGVGLRIGTKKSAAAGMKSDYWSWHGYKYYFVVRDNIKAYRDYLQFSWDTQAVYDVPQIVSEISLLL